MTAEHHMASTTVERREAAACRRRRTGQVVCGLVVALVLTAALPAVAAAATLYVDRHNSSCVNSGTGAGSATRPFCTIGAAASRATGGTIVQVSAGTYTEEVSPRSGVAQNPVVFQNDPGETVTVRGGTYGFYVSNKTWVTIRGFNVTETLSDGFHVSNNSSFVKVLNNHVSFVGEQTSTGTAKAISLTDSSDSTIQGNVVHDASNFGIYLVNATRNQVVGNETSFNARVFSRGASGIRLHSSFGNTISANVTHDNEDSGIELVTGSTNNLVVNNVAYGNGDHGIDLLDSGGNRVVANSVYDNVTAGINAEGTSSSTTMTNNISAGNAIDSPRTVGNIRVDSTSISGSAVNSNLVHHTDPSGVMYVWGSTPYSTLAAFKSATGQESRGLQADPRWKDPATGDLHLNGGSPAIDSADSSAAGAQTTDADGNQRVDDPSAANTGVGVRAYDDRGAYERQLTQEPPVAALDVTPSSGPAPLQVTADASASTDFDDSPIASYRFNFGDGTIVGPQAGATATHTYAEKGTYTVTVTVTDTGGRSGTATREVTVLGIERPPDAALAVTPSTGRAPLAVRADASGTTSPDGRAIESYRFDFGDGTVVGPQAGATADHTYTEGGTYTVTLRVTDAAGLSATKTADVEVFANLVSNRDFEHGLAGWNTSGGAAGVTLTQVAGGHSGQFAARLANGASTAGTCLLNDAPNVVMNTSNHTYTATLWARADAPGTTLKLRFREYSNGVLAGTRTEEYVLMTTWREVTVAYTPAAPGSSLDFSAYVVGAPPGNCFDVDDVSIEPGPVEPPPPPDPNLIDNRGFEQDVSGWNTSGGSAGVTLTRAPGGHSGSFAARLANGGTAAGTCTLNDAPNVVTTTSGGVYTFKLWARADAPGATLKLRIREYAGGVLAGSQITERALSTDWQEVTVALAPAAPGSSLLDLNAYATGVPPGTCFYADDASLTLG